MNSLSKKETTVNLIDLEKSYVFFHADGNNCWRTEIKSVLENRTASKRFYLVKECRAEMVGKYPFRHPAKSELLGVIEENKATYFIRDIPCFKGDDFSRHNYQITGIEGNEVLATIGSFRRVTYSECRNILEDRIREGIYCKINFEFERNKYSILSKCEYLNFPGRKSPRGQTADNDYLQPIIGYVPFEMECKIYIAYVVKYLSPDLEGRLEFRVRKNCPLRAVLPARPVGIRGLAKAFLAHLLPFIEVSEFLGYVSLENSEVEFFVREQPRLRRD